MKETVREFTTPMMKQYSKIKKEYSDCLLFFRLGDFYELFMEDAEIGSQVLDITLTARPNGKSGKVPMAGVPYHAVDSYLAKLVRAGYKVAICEQVSEPNKYGIVDREVVRIVTPGTVLDEKALEKKENNYIVSLLYDRSYISITCCDISTGQLVTLEKEYTNLAQELKNELSQLNPAECILSPKFYGDFELLKILKQQRGMNIYPYKEWDDYAFEPSNLLKSHFGIKTLKSFDIDDKPLSQITSAALLGYLKHTQKDKIGHIKKITLLKSHEYVALDRSTIINLELFSTIRDHDTKGTLLSVLDETKTAMGGRMLKGWIKQPLIQKNLINARLDAVEELTKNTKETKHINETLETITDIERVFSRLSVGIGNARDMINLKEDLKKILLLKHRLVKFDSSLLQKLQKHILPSLQQVIHLIENSIVDEPPISLKDGGIIRNGIDQDLDLLKGKVGGGKAWIINLEKEERQKTGIGSLKVRFNKVFGFYIEISKSNLHLVPNTYIRKQTLVNGERFITTKLKEQEDMILSAEEKMKEIEYTIYTDILKQILAYTEAVQRASTAIATLDCLANFATLAQKNNYIRPKLIYSGEIKIKDGRHPVVEKLLDMAFVPNDVSLDNIRQSLLIITGPNMAGKSVFIRQVALIVLMAQIGSFVPAKHAYISLVDRIFVRSGASDVITSGLSTFMVEMVETSYILNNATKRSLIVMDEIGRGTSTYDGISIAWAVAEYLVTHFKTPPKTLFATHYHELQALEKAFLRKIKNYHMAVIPDEGEPVFLHTIKKGAASHSFGVAVARLAGLPDEVIKRAYTLLPELESWQKKDTKNNKPKITNFPELETIDVDQTTPLEALHILSNLKTKYGKHT